MQIYLVVMITENIPDINRFSSTKLCITSMISSKTEFVNIVLTTEANFVHIFIERRKLAGNKRYNEIVLLH